MKRVSENQTMLEVNIKINGIDHGMNYYGSDGFCDAFYDASNEYGDDFHYDLMVMLSALIDKGHLQGGFLVGYQNHAIDFYAYPEA
jgi:hypothetical protein